MALLLPQARGWPRLGRSRSSTVGLRPPQPAVDFFTHEVMIHPVTNRPADKRSFIPSLIEKEKVRGARSPALLPPEPLLGHSSGLTGPLSSSPPGPAVILPPL